MIAPVSRLKKSEIVWLATHRCKHKHTYLEHYNCYLKECPDKGSMGFFDIETSNLRANYGIVYCYSIKPRGSDEIIRRTITKKELKSKSFDKAVISQCIKDLRKFDIIIGYYSSRFDIPYIRSRALYHGLPFPAYGELNQIDLYYIVRNKFALNRNSLKVATGFLLGDTHKTEINNEYWIRAMQGDKESLEYIQHHCDMDVIDTERLYNKVITFRKRLDQSV